MFNIFGCKIIQDIYCLTYEEEIQQKSWKERLFTYPYKFWIKYKTISITKPAIMKLGKDTFVCHPSLYIKLQREINETNINNKNL